MIVNNKYLIFSFIALLMAINSSIAGGQDSLKLTLDDCISLALKNNFDLQIEKQQIRESQARLKEIQAVRLPQVNLLASYLRFSEVMEASITPEIQGLPFQIAPMYLRFGDEDNYMTKLNVSQLLFSGFKIKNNIKATENHVEATKYNEKIQVNRLVFKLKETYYNLINAQKLKEVTVLSQNTIAAHLKDIQNLFDQGMVNKNEVLKVEIKKSEMELLNHQAANRIELLKKLLLTLMGLDLNSRISIEDQLIFMPDSLNSTQAVRYATQSRPEINQVEFFLKSSQNLIKSAKSEFFPSLSLMGSYEYGKPGYNKFENKWLGFWTLGIAAQWNIWDWGIRNSKIEKAEVGKNKLKYARKKLKQAIELETQNALLKEKEAKKRVLISRQIKQQAAENFRLVKNQFQQGLVTNTEFLDSENQLTKTNIDELRAIVDYNIALADVDRAMGNSAVK